MKGVFIIKANYKRLWHILLDKNMKKKDLAKLADHINCLEGIPSSCRDVFVENSAR